MVDRLDHQPMIDTDHPRPYLEFRTPLHLALLDCLLTAGNQAQQRGAPADGQLPTHGRKGSESHYSGHMEHRPVLIGAALNGEREHPAVPRSPSQLAQAARSSVDAGARVLHLHPFGPDGQQTLDSASCAEAILAVREACRGIPLSLSTSAAIEPDPGRRLKLIEQWEIQPDLVTANQGEAGIEAVCELLVGRGVGIEAGLLCHTDAEAFANSTVPAIATRVLIEPLDEDPTVACEHAERMESILEEAGIDLPQMHHGDGVASWAVNERGLAQGHDIRTGIEDTGYLPDGSPAADNESLIRAATALVGDAGRTLADT